MAISGSLRPPRGFVGLCKCLKQHRCFSHSSKANRDYVNAFTSLRKNSEHTRCRETPQRKQSIAIKDNICTLDYLTTCASGALYDFNPRYDATVVSLLRKAGYDIIGKTNCDEFGMGSLNTHSVHGPVLNPFNASVDASVLHNNARSAGGSSGGSAAAVAAGMCTAALGTDTGGSIRLPASYCGIFGFKPSYGIVSRWGVVSFADSLDCVGILAKQISRLKEVYSVIARYDPLDPTSATTNLRDLAQRWVRATLEKWQTAEGCLNGVKIGVPLESFPTELLPSSSAIFRRFLTNLKAQGAELIPISLPSTPYALSAYYVLSSAEASSNLARFDGVRFGTRTPSPTNTDTGSTSDVYAVSRSKCLGSEAKRRVLLGTYALTASSFDNYFLQAQRIRQLVKADFDRVFSQPNVLTSKGKPPEPKFSNPYPKVDVVVHLSAIRTAPLLSEQPPGLDGYVQDVMTVPASLAGLPAISIPAGVGENGRPVGVSVVGQWGCDDLILELGELLQSAGMTLPEDY